MTPRTKRDRIVRDLRNKEFRGAFVESLIADRLPAQIREMRLSRGWSQSELGRRAGKTQSFINRIERMDQPFVAVRTLLEVAEAFDVGLKVCFVPFSELADDFSSPSNTLNVPCFDADMALSPMHNAPPSLVIEYSPYMTAESPFAALPEPQSIRLEEFEHGYEKAASSRQ